MNLTFIILESIAAIIFGIWLTYKEQHEEEDSFDYKLNQLERAGVIPL